MIASFRHRSQYSEKYTYSSAGGDRHSGNHRVQAPAAGTLDRDCGRRQQLVGKRGREDGQSTVEFAVVMVGFLAVTVALSTMWRAFSGGMLVDHAVAVASHHVQGVAAATLVDIFLY